MEQSNFLAKFLKGTLSLTKTVNVNEVSGGLSKKNSILIQGDAGKLAALTPAELFAMPEVRDAIAAVFLLGAYNQPVQHWDGTYGWRFLGDYGASDGAILVHRAFVADRALSADNAANLLGLLSAPSAPDVVHWDGVYGYRHFGDWAAGGNGAILVHRAFVADRAQVADGSAGQFVATGLLESRLASNPGIAFHKPGIFGAFLTLDDTNWLSTKGWSSGDGFASLRVGNLQLNGKLIFPDGSSMDKAASGGIDRATLDAAIAAAMGQVDGKIAFAIAQAMVQVDAKIAAAIAAATASILQQVDAKIAAAISNSPSPSPTPMPVLSIGNPALGRDSTVKAFTVNEPPEQDPIVRIGLWPKPISNWREWLAAGRDLKYRVSVSCDHPQKTLVADFTFAHGDMFDANGNIVGNPIAIDTIYKATGTNFAASIYAFSTTANQTSQTSQISFRWPAFGGWPESGF